MAALTLKEAILTNDLKWIRSQINDKLIDWEELLLLSVKVNNSVTFLLAINNIPTDAPVLTKAFREAIKRNDQYYAKRIYEYSTKNQQIPWEVITVELNNLSMYKFMLQFDTTLDLNNVLTVAIKYNRREFVDYLMIEKDKLSMRNAFNVALNNNNIHYIDFFYQQLDDVNKKYARGEAIYNACVAQNIERLECLISFEIGSLHDVRATLGSHPELIVVKDYLNRADIEQMKARLCDSIMNMNLSLNQLKRVDNMIKALDMQNELVGYPNNE